MASHMARLRTLGRARHLLYRIHHCKECCRTLHSSKLLFSENPPRKNEQDDDFFGIGEETSMGQSESESNKSSALSVEELEKKYTFYRKDLHSKDVEQFLETSFGLVRLDHARITTRRDKLGLPMASQFARNIEGRRKGLESVQSKREKRSRGRKKVSEVADGEKAQFVDADNIRSSPTDAEALQQSGTPDRRAEGSHTIESSTVNIFDEQYFGTISQSGVDMNANATGAREVGKGQRAQQLAWDSVGHEGTSGTKQIESDANVTDSECRASPASNFIDEQYFGHILEKSTSNVSSGSPQEQDMNIFEEQYFGERSGSPSENVDVRSVDSRVDAKKSPAVSSEGGVEYHVSNKSNKSPDSDSFIEEQYFSRSMPSEASAESRSFMEISAGTSSEPAFDAFVQDMLSVSQPLPNQKLKPPKMVSEVGKAEENRGPSLSHPNSLADSENKGSALPRITKPWQPVSGREPQTLSAESDAGAVTATVDATEDLDTGVMGTITRRSQKELERARANTDRPQTAFDMAMKIRQELKEKRKQQSTSSDPEREEEAVVQTKFQGPVDSKGFRILKSQVPDLSDLPSSMAVSLLRDSVLYNKGDIVAIDKPYGLPSHDGPGQRLSVGGLLPELARALDRRHPNPSLHLVHRLDKDTTGVMLLAKSEQMALQLTAMFQHQEVIRRYWVLTKGVPDPTEGIIDIPIYEGKVNGIYRRALLPPFTEETKLVMNKSQREAQPAATRYRVLHSNSSAALVLVQPITGVKHQVRVHLAFGLNTPILGDHKYSHFSRIAPQKLYSETLQRLGIRQSKVRHLPMHLHLHSLVLPELLDGANLFLTARLPRHFRTNMKRLKIKPPSGRQEIDH